MSALVSNASVEEQASAIPIINATSTKNLGKLITLIGEKVDLSVHAPGGGKTPLHIAAELNFVEGAALLIAAMANVNALTNSLFTSLHVAAQKGSVRLIEMLAEADAEIDARNNGGCTPLHEAAAKGYFAAVRKLREFNANPTLIDFQAKVNADQLAGINHHPDVKNFLLRENKVNKPASSSSTKDLGNYQLTFIREVRSILIDCLEKFPQIFPEYQLIQEFRKKIASITDGDDLFLKVKSALVSQEYKEASSALKPIRQLLIQAMKKYNQGKLEAAKKTAPAADVENKDNTEDLTNQFFLAITSKKVDNVRDCIRKKVDVDKRIVMPANTPHYNPVYLHENESKISGQLTTKIGESPIYLATSTGSFRIVQILIVEGRAKTDQVENNGLTALMLACQRTYLLIVGILLLNGAPVDSEAFDGSTALNFGSEVGDVSIVRLLIAFKADVNHADKDGETPLIIATVRGHEVTVNELLINGANADKAKPNGVTPAFLAAQNGFLRILKLLEPYGVNLNQKRNTDNISILDIATAMGKHDVVDYLKSKGVTA